MSKGRFFVCALVFFAGLSLAGCTRVRTYVVEKERVDLDLTAGNAGYLAGTPASSDVPKDRKLTRQTYVTEVELGGVARRVKKTTLQKSKTAMTVEMAQEPAGAAVIEEALPAPAAEDKGAAVTSYTVQNNDNLEKISQKVYGTPAKWKKIFEANADKMKNPDRIYAGQVLKIPQE